MLKKASISPLGRGIFLIFSIFIITAFIFGCSEGSKGAEENEITTNIQDNNDNSNNNSKNTAPVAEGSSMTIPSSLEIPIILQANDPDGDVIVYTIEKAPEHGVLTGTPPDMIYTSNADFKGSDSFQFYVSDGKDSSETATVALGVVKAWFVDKEAAGLNDGSSWDNAFKHPQKGVDASSEDEEVWVADGSYTRMNDTDTVLLQMKYGVKIYGGFSGTELSFEERNLEGNTVELNGESLARVVIGENNAVLDGFSIINGTEESGGGIYNYETSPSIANCVIKENSAWRRGGGLYNFNCSPVIIDCRFTENLAAWNGGAIYNEDSSPKISGCTFTSNAVYASYNWDYGCGGAIASYNSSLELTDCTFILNFAPLKGGSIYSEASTSTMKNCTFVNNYSELEGGCIYTKSSSPTITECKFLENEAGMGGGGILSHDGSPTIVKCEFIGNIAPGSGIMNKNCSPIIEECEFRNNSHTCIINAGCSDSLTITNCVFTHNTSGAINNSNSSPVITGCTFTDNTTTGTGGAVFNYYGSPRIVDCAFEDNVAWKGGAICNYYSGSSEIINCSFTGNDITNCGEGGGIYNTSVDSVSIRNCTFDRNINNSVFSYVSPTTITGCEFSYSKQGPAVELFKSPANISGCSFNENISVYGAGIRIRECFDNEVNVGDCAFTGNICDYTGVQSGQFPSFYYSGAGISIENSGSPEIANCNFTDNMVIGFNTYGRSTGGGLHIKDSSPLITECSFTGNKATTSGGAMYVVSNSDPVITNCTFTDNTAASHSGVFSDETSTVTYE